jgi:hypothetical protein
MTHGAAQAGALRRGLDVRAAADAALGGEAVRGGAGGARRVVANFNNWKKLDPETLAAWAQVRAPRGALRARGAICILRHPGGCLFAERRGRQVLRGAPGAVLWLIRMLPYPGPEDALRRALADARVDPARLLVTEMLPFATHLLLKRQVRTKRVSPRAACGGGRVACWPGRLLSFGQPRRRRRRRIDLPGGGPS